VIATHSSARALADTPRNLADAQIREIAASNGIIGVSAVHGMLAPGRTSSILHVVKRIRSVMPVSDGVCVALYQRQTAAARRPTRRAEPLGPRSTQAVS
jgi:microsomal dipeptidase-like Zn-dependent dipeptidase